MARPLRLQSEKQLYYVSNFCIQQAYLLLPTDLANAIILGCMARAVLFYPVKIYCFNFLLNRFDMIVSAPELNLPAFMRAFQGQLATELNKHLGRKGKFFEGRYYKADILDTPALLERFNFITNAPVERGLVERLEDWQGVNSWGYLLRGERVSGRWINRTERRKHERKAKNKRKKYTVPKNAGQEQHTFTLSRLPGLEKLSDTEYRQQLRAQVEARTDALRKKMRERRKKALGMAKILQFKWYERPEGYEDLPRLICYGAEELCRAYLQKLKAITRDYAEAMEVYVENEEVAVFPLYTCRPGLIDCERPDEGEPKPGSPDAAPEEKTATASASS